MAFEILLVSLPDREKLVAEIYWEDMQLAEVNEETQTVMIELYPRRDGQPWSVPFDDLFETLAKAKGRLLGTIQP